MISSFTEKDLQETYMLRIKELSNYEQFRGMKEAWDDLISRSKTDNIFLSHEWMDSYIRNCCNYSRLLILTVFDNDVLVCIAPLMIRKYNFMGISVKFCCFIGTTVSDKMDFILNEPKEKSVPLIMDYLMGINADWDFLDFKEIPESSGTLEIIEKWVKLQKMKFILDPRERSFFLKLDSDKDFLLRKISRKLHRKMNKLSKLVKGRLEFKHYANDEIKESLFSDIQFIAKHSWKARRQKNIFLKKSIKSFHRELFLNFARYEYLDISTLSIDHIPIAYIYNFLYNNRSYSYGIEFHMKYKHISPGTMLMLWHIENSTSQGIKEIDFCKGDETWKERLTDDFRMQASVRIFNNSFYGKGLYLLCFGVKCIKENLKRHRVIYEMLRKVKQRFI